MTWGGMTEPWGSAPPWGGLDGDLDESTPDLFAAVLADLDTQFIYVVIATPYAHIANKSMNQPPWGAGPAWGDFTSMAYPQGRTDVYLANREFATEPSDTPANQPFLARLSSSFTFETTLFEGAEPDGRGSSAAGEINVEIGDGVVDAYVDYGWDGATVEVRAGTVDLAFSDFATIFLGVADGIEFDESRLRVRLRDKRFLIERPVQETRYAGTGGIEGDADIANVLKPWALGRVFNAEPVLINQANLIYQISYRSIDSISAVKDKGVALSFDTDYADYTELLNATVAGGDYATCLALGLVRLGGSPDGTVTIDLRGDNDATYVEKTGSVIQRILTVAAGFTAAADIDGASINVLDATETAPIGFYTGTREIEIARLCDMLMVGVGGGWVFDRLGKFSAKVLREPGNPEHTIKEADIIDGRLDPVVALRPTWRRTYGYKPVSHVQTEDELAGSVSEQDRVILGNDFRIVEASDVAVKTSHTAAREVRTDGFMDQESDAQAQVNKMQALRGRGRQRWRVTVNRRLFRLRVGDTVTLEHSRFGLSSGKNFFVAAVGEDADDDETTLELWG